jgi:5-methylcytosine-specific restriction protein A
VPNKPPIFCPPGAVFWESERERKAAPDRTRPSTTDRSYDAAWRRVRSAFAAAHPVCYQPGCREATQEIDHILSVRERPDLRLSWSNLRSFCKSYHSARTARDQGFGRKS